MEQDLHIFPIILGKSVVSKECAIRIQKENPRKPVYFISLVGSSPEGKPQMTRFVFDVLTERYEFNRRNTAVQLRDAKFLFEYYTNYCKTRGKLAPDVYELAEFYLQKNPNAHFIFDEVPILKCEDKDGKRI